MIEREEGVPERAENAGEETSIRIDSLVVRYGRKAVLDGVDLTVRTGEVHALLGRNGAGKSSLIRCLLGQQKPQGGRVLLLGLDVWRYRARLANRVGIVPETADAPPAIDVLALSRFCGQLYATWNQAGLLARLARFDVPTNVPFGTLSKGQQAQVMLALALAHEPEILILDDPTLGLDVVARRAVFEELVIELADRGITVLLTSHDLLGVESIATRVTLLQGGRFVFDEHLEALKTRFRRLRLGPNVARDRLDPFGPLNVKTVGRDLEAVVGDFDEALYAEICRGPGIERTEALPLSLEEIVVAAGGIASGPITETPGELGS